MANGLFGANSTSTLKYIEDMADLNAIRSLSNTVSYIQTADIDASAWGPFEPLFGKSADKTMFAGSYDGKGFKIHNLTVNSSITGYNGVGLFGVITNGVTIKNVHLRNVQFPDNTSYAGGIAGRYVNNSTSSYTAQIMNCSVTGKVSGGHAGGILGGYNGGGYWTTLDNKPNYLKIIRCYSVAEVYATSNAGGLVGYVYEGSNDTNTIDRVNITESYCASPQISGNIAGGLIGLIGCNFSYVNSCNRVGISKSYSLSQKIVQRSTFTPSTKTGVAIAAYNKGIGDLIGYAENNAYDPGYKTTITLSSNYSLDSIQFLAEYL